MEQRKRKQNDKLDLFKCIAIYAVIMAHIPFPGQFGRAICALAKFSVVLFFMISGYFSWGAGSKGLAKRAGKTLSMLLWVCLGLLMFGCILTVKSGGSVPAYLLGRFHPLYLKELVLYQMVPLAYSWPMWYLTSQLVVYLLWWGMTLLAERKGKPLPYNALAVLAVVLLAINIALGEGLALINGNPVDNYKLRNAWLDGFPCFALGAWMGAHREQIETHLRPSLAWAGVVACALFNLVEFSLIDVVDVFLGTTLMAALLVTIGIARPEVNSPLLRRTACFCGSRLTFQIYVIHVPLYGIIKEWQNMVPAFAWYMEQEWLRTILISFLSTVLAVLLYHQPRYGKVKRRKAHENY